MYLCPRGDVFGEWAHSLIDSSSEGFRVALVRNWVMSLLPLFSLILSTKKRALKAQLEEMRRQTIALGVKVVCRAPSPDTEAIGKCFLGYNYSKTHPVQTMRAKKMWDILNGSLDTFDSLYDGVAHCFRVHPSDDGLEYDSCNQVLYLGEEIDNWNEGLDEEFTKDLHLIYAFHNLWDHMHFSIFDLLWIRDFSVELFVESSYTTYSGDYDDLNWRKYDFYD